MWAGAVLWLALLAAPAAARDDGVGKPQPRDSSGLPLTLTVVNPSTVDATLVRVKGKRRDPAGTVRSGSSLAVSTLPGERFVAYFPCRGRSAAHKVPRWLADEWKLPARPCR